MSSYQQELIRYLAQRNTILSCRKIGRNFLIYIHYIYIIQILFLLMNVNLKLKLYLIQFYIWKPKIFLFGVSFKSYSEDWGHWALWMYIETICFRGTFELKLFQTEFLYNWCIQNRGYVENVIYWSEWMTLNVHRIRESLYTHTNINTINKNHFSLSELLSLV